MEHSKEQQMNRGALLFAFNNYEVDYFKMAVATAKRIRHFLNIPVTVITDENNFHQIFDKIIAIPSDKSNTKQQKLWLNKGRYQAYELSPYDETLLLDTDYLVNSNMLSTIFDICTDYICPKNVNYLMYNSESESMGVQAPDTLWATLIAFKKTNKSKQLFECLKMVQENYNHYIEIFNIYSTMYRNDYALAISHRIVNGQFDDKTNYLPWDLVHVPTDIKIYKLTNDEFNTQYKIIREHNTRNKTFCEYNIVTDTDFHCLDKDTYMELTNE